MQFSKIFEVGGLELNKKTLNIIMRGGLLSNILKQF